jgi:RimJ/RimL family protein N-acetyltransferase
LIETERLILRRWRAADLAPFAAMMADPEVGDWLGGTRTRAEARAELARTEAALEASGFGMWAIERLDDGQFIGGAMLRPVHESLQVAPAVEVGWRLARDGWGHGYATESAAALLRHGFEDLGIPEIVAFTADTNLRSQAVMRRLGMRRDPARDFNHPGLPPGHPLRPHVVYAARAAASRAL